jgi:uncharacterized membrane protein YeiB
VKEKHALKVTVVEVPDSVGRRIIAYDLARAVALFGMILINFNLFLEIPNPEPVWLIEILRKIEGRAAALFVILAGAGLSLMTRRAYLAGDSKLMAEKRKSLLKRALFLFLAGLLNRLFWSADILHFYGVYLTIATLFLTIPDRHLWSSAAGSMFVFIFLTVCFNSDNGWVWGSNVYVGFYSFDGMLRYIFFNGYYPVFPWLAFLLVGMWLGRKDLSNRVFRKKMLWYGMGAVCFIEIWLWSIDYITSFYWDFSDSDYLELLLDMDPWQPMPQFIISAAGSALAVIMLCAFLAEKFKRFPLLPMLVAAGQMSLTLYVFHILFAGIIFNYAVPVTLRTLLFLTGMAIGFYCIALLLVFFWKARFGRGPLEALMRRFLNSSKNLTTHCIVGSSAHRLHLPQYE